MPAPVSKSLVYPSVNQVALELTSALITSGKVTIPGTGYAALAQQALALYEAVRAETKKSLANE